MVTTTEERLASGRAANELRPLTCEQSALFRADGSARMSHGNSTVLAAVYGPGPSNLRRNEDSDIATLTVCVKLEKGVTTSNEKEMELLIRQTFEPVILLENFPRAVISIIVQIIENQGSVLAVAMNAVNVALMDAGIPMTAVVTCATTCVSKDGTLILDPSAMEEESAEALVTAAYANKSDGILTSVTSGLLSEENYFACAEACLRASKSVAAFIRLVQQNKYPEKPSE